MFSFYFRQSFEFLLLSILSSINLFYREKGWGESILFDFWPRGEYYYPFKRISQLTDVTRPIVFKDFLHHFIRDYREDSLLQVRCGLFYESLNQGGDIFFSIPEGKQITFQDIQPVIKSVQKSSIRRRFLQVVAG